MFEEDVRASVHCLIRTQEREKFACADLAIPGAHVSAMICARTDWPWAGSSEPVAQLL
jgi:hypothetical protein